MFGLSAGVIVHKSHFGILLVTGGMTHQEGYARGFQADPRCKIVGLTDELDVNQRRAHLNRELAIQLGVPLLPNLDTALEIADVDAVSVCSEFERRARVSEKCVRAGKHLYVDKPMATTVEDARSVVKAVAQEGVHSQMFTQVGQPYAQRAKAIVEAGTLGELRSIHCDLLFAKGYARGVKLGQPRREHYPPKDFTFPDAKREVWTTAVYSLTLINYLTGRPIRSVYAKTENYFFEEHSNRDVEDFGVLALTLEGGITATIIASRIGWHSYRSFGPNLTRLYGNKGSVLIDAHRPRWDIASDRPEWTPPPRDPLDPMGFWASTMDRAQARPRTDWYSPQTMPAVSDQSLFLDCLEKNENAIISATVAAHASEVMLAAYRSAATGKVVDLNR